MTIGARADAFDQSVFSFNGFGTLGLTHSSEPLADFTSTFFKPNGAGYTRKWSSDVDSRIGGQVTANFNKQLSAVLQVIVEQRFDNTYTPAVEWANIKYEFTPDLSVRFGRILLPIFQISDYRKVSYAYAWVRPPNEVYTMVPFANNDGIDVTYRFHVGDVINTTQGIYSRFHYSLPKSIGGGSTSAENVSSLFNTTEYGHASVRLAYINSKFTTTFPGLTLFDAFRQFGPEGIAIANKYDPFNKLMIYTGIGATYDPGKWFVTGELSQTNAHSFIGKKQAWYISSGFRFDKFTPYFIYAKAKAKSETSDPGLTLSALPPELVGTAAAMNGALNSTALLKSIPVQNTISLGARWDVMKDVSLKVQYDYTTLRNGSFGTLINLQPGFQPDSKVKVVSAVLDFVF